MTRRTGSSAPAPTGGSLWRRGFRSRARSTSPLYGSSASAWDGRPVVEIENYVAVVFPLGIFVGKVATGPVLSRDQAQAKRAHSIAEICLIQHFRPRKHCVPREQRVD